MPPDLALAQQAARPIASKTFSRSKTSRPARRDVWRMLQALPAPAPASVEVPTAPVAMSTPVSAASERKRERGSAIVVRVVAAVGRIVVVGVATVPRAVPVSAMPPTAATAIAAILNRLHVGAGLLLQTGKIACRASRRWSRP